MLTSSAALSGEFTGLSDNMFFQSTDGFRTFRINYTANSVVLTAVPEPSLTFVSLAILGLGTARRQRSKT